MSRILSASLLAAALADTRQHSSGGGSAICPCEDGDFEDNEPVVDAFDELERLGTITTVDNDVTITEMRDHLNASRAALLQVRGDQQRTGERLARILPEGEAKLKRLHETSRAQWNPEGGDQHVFSRYLNDDGSVRLGRSVTRYRLPDGREDSTARHGLFTEPFPVSRSAQRVREAYRRYAFAYAYARKSHRDNPWSSELLRRSFRSFRQACLEMPGAVGSFFREAFENPEKLRAVNNTSGVGGELIATPTIADVRRPTDLARRIAGLFRSYDVPSSSFKRPTITGRPLAYKRGKTSTDDPAAYPVSTFTSSEDTLSVVDRVIQALIDPVWASDAGLILPDPIGTVLDWLEMGDADTLEIAILHGDVNASHQDAIASWTLGGRYAAGALDGSKSPMKFWQGARARAFDDGAVIAGGGTFDISDHSQALDAMGVHAEGAVIITGLHGYYTQLIGSSELATMDQIGERATLVSGEVASYAGKPVVLSQMVTNDLANTGLYTSSGTTTEFIYLNPERGVLASHQGGSDDYDATYPERGARYVGSIRRSRFFYDCPDDEVPAAVVSNL